MYDTVYSKLYYRYAVLSDKNVPRARAFNALTSTLFAA